MGRWTDGQMDRWTNGKIQMDRDTGREVEKRHTDRQIEK